MLVVLSISVGRRSKVEGPQLVLFLSCSSHSLYWTRSVLLCYQHRLYAHFQRQHLSHAHTHTTTTQAHITRHTHTPPPPTHHNNNHPPTHPHPTTHTPPHPHTHTRTRTHTHTQACRA